MSITWYLTAVRGYARFEGRAARREFWSFLVGGALVCILAAAVEAQILQGTGQHRPVLVWFVALAHVIPAYAVTVRRLHDTDHTGWLALLNAIPLGALVILVLGCLPGTPWPNRYGPVPEGEAAATRPASNDYPGPEAADPNADGFDFLAGGYPKRPAAADEAPPPSSAPAPTSVQAPGAPRDIIGELERLAQLKAAGVLSDAEFASLKAHLLDATLRS